MTEGSPLLHTPDQIVDAGERNASDLVTSLPLMCSPASLMLRSFPKRR